MSMAYIEVHPLSKFGYLQVANMSLNIFFRVFHY